MSALQATGQSVDNRFDAVGHWAQGIGTVVDHLQQEYGATDAQLHQLRYQIAEISPEVARLSVEVDSHGMGLNRVVGELRHHATMFENHERALDTHQKIFEDTLPEWHGKLAPIPTMQTDLHWACDEVASLQIKMGQLENWMQKRDESEKTLQTDLEKVQVDIVSMISKLTGKIEVLDRGFAGVQKSLEEEKTKEHDCPKGRILEGNVAFLSGVVEDLQKQVGGCLSEQMAESLERIQRGEYGILPAQLDKLDKEIGKIAEVVGVHKTKLDFVREQQENVVKKLSSQFFVALQTSLDAMKKIGCQ